MGFLDDSGLSRLWEHISLRLSTKVTKVEGKDLSTNDYTTAEKEKLGGIAAGANKTAVDSALSSSSTNPVQNKIVYTALNGKVPTTTTINGKALTGNITLSASDVNADAEGAADAALANANAYTNSALNIAKNYTDQAVDNITSGSVSVFYANTAGHADTAGTSDSATKATQDSSGNVINTTYETKVDATAKLNSAKAYTDSEIDGLTDIYYTETEIDAKVSALNSTIDSKASNAFSNIAVGSTTIAANSKSDTLTFVAGANVTLTPDTANDKVTIVATDTKYSAGTGISLAGTTFSNSGVRSVATGSTNGTISVNTGGTSTNVAVKGLGTAAYTDSSAYDAYGTAQTKADEAYGNANAYTDQAVAAVKNELLNGAGAAYDTLKELGDLIDDNADAIDALETIAADKADNKDMTGATSSAAGTHGLVPAPAAGKQISFLRGDGTWAIPTNTTYVAATSSKLGLVKSGTDITVDSDGNVSVNDDSHNHTIANIDNLQSTLDTMDASIDGSIKSLSVSGRDITYTKNDGSTGKITTQDNNTLNTAGSTDTSSKIFLVGTKSQTSSAQTYSHDTAYVGENGFLYSGGSKVSVDGHTHTVANINGLNATVEELNYMVGVTNKVQEQLNAKASTSSLSSHTADTNVHLTSTDRTNLTAAYNHSQADHAPAGAEVNQNAFSNVKVGSTTIASGGKTATLTLAAGSNVTLTPNNTNKQVTIAATIPTASTTIGGVKTTSTVTSTSGLTATPIIGGVPYYKDTTYSAITPDQINTIFNEVFA